MAKRLLAILLLVSCGRPPRHSGVLGDPIPPVSHINQVALNAVTTTGVSNVVNLTINPTIQSHILTWTTTGSPTSIQIQLEGSATGLSGWNTISPAAGTTASGFIIAAGWWPYVRADLVVFSGGSAPTLTATYLGAEGGGVQTASGSGPSPTTYPPWNCIVTPSTVSAQCEAAPGANQLYISDIQVTNSNGAQSVKIVSGTGTVCAAGKTVIKHYSLATIDNVTEALPTAIPVGDGNNLCCLSTSSSAAFSCSISGYIAP